MTVKRGSNTLTTRSQSNPDFDKFKALATKLVSVPKKDIQEREKAEKQVTEAKKS